MNVSFDENSTQTSEHNCSELVLKHKASIQPRIEPASKPSTSSNSNSISSELDLFFIDAFDEICADFDKGIITSTPSSEVPTLVEDIFGPSEEVIETSTPSGTTTSIVSDATNSESVSKDIPPGNEVLSTSATIPEASVSETPIQDVPRTSEDLHAVYNEYNETNTQQTIESLPSTHRWTKDHPYTT
ncbi:hypothetical protein L6452_34425 [Arctium lappa]|uniref:Uncharacterized protein n=1 Tax=Arctium lappa TaxID=4217 RepID=A0ACB8YJ69_ARCLA|nr:hypothetical protein L6452_34425 [Arctium lappa]